MKKRVSILLTVALCTVSMVAGVAASDIVKKISAELRPDFTVVIDGEVKTFKNAQGDIVYPVLYNGTTYLPVRAIGELMGKKVYWYEEEKKVELKQETEPTVTDADVIVTDTAEGSKEEKEFGKKDNPKKDKADKITDKIDKTKDKASDKIDKTADKLEKADKTKKVDADELITKEQAKAVVLEKAGLTEADVKFVKIEKDYDDGIVKYDIEFRKGLTEYP